MRLTNLSPLRLKTSAEEPKGLEGSSNGLGAGTREAAQIKGCCFLDYATALGRYGGFIVQVLQCFSVKQCMDGDNLHDQHWTQLCDPHGAQLHRAQLS